MRRMNINLKSTDQSKVKEQQIVLIHGWGMNRGVWQGIVEQLLLSIDLDILCLDLPGYAGSAKIEGENSLDEMAYLLEQQIDKSKEIVLIGWSLGGLVAIALANRLKLRVSSLVLLSSTPKFTQSSDWPCAVEQKIFNNFAKQLVNDYQKVIQRFIAITVMGSPTAKQDRKNLIQALESIQAGTEQDKTVLEQGLNVLLETDYRQTLLDLKTPVFLVLGDRDTLVPLAAMETIAQAKQAKNHQCSLITIHGAGHAPFISHQKECINHLLKILTLNT